MTLRIALAQLVVAEALDANLRKITDFIARAANEGAARRTGRFGSKARRGP